MGHDTFFLYCSAGYRQDKRCQFVVKSHLDSWRIRGSTGMTEEGRIAASLPSSLEVLTHAHAEYTAPGPHRK